jgi:hypothetical protein
LLTRLPGAKKRISIVFRGVKPGTSGQTTGRNSSETKHSAGCGWADVNGRRIKLRGGLNARLNILPNAALGTPILSSGMEPPAWKIPAVVRRRSRVVQHALFHR